MKGCGHPDGCPCCPEHPDGRASRGSNYEAFDEIKAVARFFGASLQVAAEMYNENQRSGRVYDRERVMRGDSVYDRTSLPVRWQAASSKYDLFSDSREDEMLKAPMTDARIAWAQQLSFMECDLSKAFSVAWEPAPQLIVGRAGDPFEATQVLGRAALSDLLAKQPDVPGVMGIREQETDNGRPLPDMRSAQSRGL